MPPEKASATAKPLASGVTADVKLPAFTADMPGVPWFNQLEAYPTVKGFPSRFNINNSLAKGYRQDRALHKAAEIVFN